MTFLHNWQGGCEFFLWEDEVVKRTTEVINEIGYVENNAGILRERRDVDDGNVDIWKEMKKTQ